MQHVIIFSSFHCKKDNRRDLLLASYFKEYVSSVSRKVLNCGQHKQTNKQTKNIRKVFFSFEARQSQNKRFYSAPPLPYNLLLLFRPFSSTSKLFQPFLLRCANAAKSLHHIFDLVFVNIINFFRVILMVFSQLSLSLVNVILNEQNSCL